MVKMLSWMIAVGCCAGLLVGCQDAPAPEGKVNATNGATDTDEQTGRDDSGDPSADASMDADQTTGDQTADTSGGTSGSGSDESVPLRIADWDEVQTLIAEHQGKVVVVDLWSTSCLPCIKEFPNLVALHKQYPEQVACISVSCDYIGLADSPPESYRDAVHAFLKEQEATFPNVLCSVPSDELFDTIDLASIPAIYVFAPDGSLAQRFDNDHLDFGNEGFTYEDHVIPLVEQLLE